MNLDQELRSVLQQESERHEAPLPDVDALWASGRARRRRQRVIQIAVGAVVAVVVSSALAVAESQRLSGGDENPAERPTPSPTVKLPAGAPPQIPYCSKATTTSPREILHVDGHDLAIWCVYRDFPQPRHHTYLWHHAERTIVESLNGVQVVTGEGAVRISTIGHPGIRISGDGRYVAWLTAYGNPGLGDDLTVYDLDEGHEVVTTPTPADTDSPSWQRVEAIDELGRVYAITGDETIWMYDIAEASWTQVQGMPEDLVVPGWYGLSYPTDDGFAVLVRESSASEPVGRSVEGQVTPDGQFVPVREVPIGVASWSPDRSQFLQLTAEGFWVQPADDFDAKVVLDLPLPEDDPRKVIWDAQWESASTVLLTVMAQEEGGSADPDTTTVVRCFTESGDCERLTGIVVPLSYQAHPGG